MKAARVLVVDDDAGMLRAVERLLTPQHEVVCCRTPGDALLSAHRHPPDIALLDVRMPEMSGFELLERLRQRWPDLDVILMTGSVHSFDNHLVQAIRAAAYYFIEKPFDREVLRTLVERCAVARRLREENRRHLARLERELRVARTFQRSLLPGGALRCGRCLLAGRYAPCDDLGGDFYDYAAAGDWACFLVADVAGHGAGAAMLTGIVKAAFRESAATAHAPQDVVRRVLAHLRTIGSQRFMSLLCGRIDSRTGRLEFLSAGHPAAIHLGRGRAPCLLEPTGPLVSPLLDQQSWELAGVPLAPGDRLLVYTDGVVEAAGDGEPFGLERLLSLLQPPAPDADALLARIEQAVRDHVGERPLSDDIALLSACYD